MKQENTQVSEVGAESDITVFALGVLRNFYSNGADPFEIINYDGGSSIMSTLSFPVLGLEEKRISAEELDLACQASLVLLVSMLEMQGVVGDGVKVVSDFIPKLVLRSKDLSYNYFPKTGEIFNLTTEIIIENGAFVSVMGGFSGGVLEGDVHAQYVSPRSGD